jgi:hypothetical protein
MWGLGRYISGLVALASARLGYLWLEAARSGPQQAEGELPDKQGVDSACHD